MHRVRHWYTRGLARDDLGEGLADDRQTVELMIPIDKRQRVHCVIESVRETDASMM